MDHLFAACFRCCATQVVSRREKSFTSESSLLKIGSSGEREMVHMSVPLHWEQTAGKGWCVFRIHSLLVFICR